VPFAAIIDGEASLLFATNLCCATLRCASSLCAALVLSAKLRSSVLHFAVLRCPALCLCFCCLMLVCSAFAFAALVSYSSLPPYCTLDYLSFIPFIPFIRLSSHLTPLFSSPLLVSHLPKQAARNCRRSIIPSFCACLTSPSSSAQFWPTWRTRTCRPDPRCWAGEAVELSLL
jgi:hypothetical protein